MKKMRQNNIQKNKKKISYKNKLPRLIENF